MTALSARSMAAFSSLLAHDAQAGRLNMRDLQVLALLAQNDEAVGLAEMAVTLSVSPAVASRIATKLVDRGLIIRFDNPTNRRASLLEPTPAGRALDAKVRAYYESSAKQPVSA